jgi:hypothetical protein
LPDRPLQVRHLFGSEARFLKVQVLGIIPTKHAVDHHHMKMQVGIEQTAEAVDKNDGADVCVDVLTEVCSAACLRRAFSQALFDVVQEAMQNGVLQIGVVEVVAKPFGEREYPLPYRQAREDVIDEVRGGFDHATGGAGGADATAFAGVSHQEVVATIGAAGASEAVGENAAFEVAAEFAFDMGAAGLRIPAKPDTPWRLSQESSSQVARCVWTVR